MLKKTKLLRLLSEYGQSNQIPQSILLSVDLPLFLTEHVDEIAYDTQNNLLFANENYLRKNKDRLNVLFLQKLLYVYLVHDARLGKYDQFVQKGSVADFVANVVSLIEINQFIEEYGLENQHLLTYDWFNQQFQTKFPTNTPAETLAEYMLEYAEIIVETGRNEQVRKMQRDRKHSGGELSDDVDRIDILSLRDNEEKLEELRERFSAEILEVNHKLSPDKTKDNLKISTALKGGKEFTIAYMTTIESENMRQSLSVFENEYKLKKEVVLKPLKNALFSLFKGDVKKTFTKLEKRPYMAKYRGIKKGYKKTKGVHNVLIRIDVSMSMNQEAIFKAIDLAKEIAISTETNIDVQGFAKYVLNNKCSMSELNFNHYSENHLKKILKHPTLARLSNKDVAVQFEDLEQYDAVIVIGDGDFAWGNQSQQGIAILLDAEQENKRMAEKVISVISMKTKDLTR